MQIEGVKIEGNFDVELWFKTIADLISKRQEGLQVTVKVTPKDKDKKSA